MFIFLIYHGVTHTTSSSPFCLWLSPSTFLIRKTLGHELYLWSLFCCASWGGFRCFFWPFEFRESFFQFLLLLQNFKKLLMPFCYICFTFKSLWLRTTEWFHPNQGSRENCLSESSEFVWQSLFQADSLQLHWYSTCFSMIPETPCKNEILWQSYNSILDNDQKYLWDDPKFSLWSWSCC